MPNSGHTTSDSPRTAGRHEDEASMRTGNIVMVITGLNLGGAETQLVRLCSALRQRHWQIRIVTMIPSGAYQAELDRIGIPVSCLHMRRKVPDPRGIWRLARLLRSYNPDIVHSFMVHANLVARVTRLFAPMPVLISSVRTISEGSRLRELLYRVTDPLCDISTHVCRVGVERYVQIKAVPAHKIRYIPNGIDTSVFRPDEEVRRRLRAELGIGEPFVWLAVGRFEPPKDYPTMLAAFSQVVQNNPRRLLLIAGEGPLRGEIESIACSLGLERYVRFLGVRRDVPQLMNAADAYVMSSSREGLPNVLLEAQATGLPAVATDVGGNREIVIDGETGFMVPPRDPNALAEAMQRLMEMDERERLLMGDAGRQHIIGNYSMEHVVQLWENLYRELLNRKGVQITLER